MRDFQRPGRSVVMAENGMAATSHPLASKVAIQMLEQGGNAVDAAIAAAVLLGICEPQMTGIGGDLFALVQPGPGQEVIGLNGSGRAPRGLDAAALRAKGAVIDPQSASGATIDPQSASGATIDPRSAAAATVPGAVDGFVMLARDHGRLGLKTCLAPAIHYAEQGVPVAPRVAADWAEDAGNLQGSARDDYLLDGHAPRAGQIFRAPKQAMALREIALEGRAGFYEGAVAEDLVAALRAAGGVHELEDFAAPQAEYVTPIRSMYRGHELIELPPNGQGAIALLLARMMERFDLSALDPFGAERAHLEAEAVKLAYAARGKWLADPAHADLGRLLSAELADELAGQIDPARAAPGPAAPLEAVHKDTVYLTVVDRERMAVSLIYSIFHSFGTGIASPDFGILVHNRGAGFTLEEGHRNEAGPGKRPMHTIIPAFLRREGGWEMPFGVMGGQYQAAGHMRFVSNVIDYGMDVQAAIDGPRAFPREGYLDLERGYPASVGAELAGRGHVLRQPQTAIGGAQAIQIRADGVLWAGSDPRKDGAALGY